MTIHAVQRRPSHRRERHPHVPAHRRYSRFVNLMKVLLPAVAAVLLALVVAWPSIRTDVDRFELGFAAMSPDAVKTLSMVNARYFGIDENNKPYTVTSDQATQPDPQLDIIVLDSPRADFTTKSGAGVILEAKQGYYHQKTQVLELEGAVSLYHEQGYELHTEEAEINLARSTARGFKPVTGNGPTGRMDGEGFVITDGGERVHVTGRSNMTFRGAKGK